jgi:hypothetical protein
MLLLSATCGTFNAAVIEVITIFLQNDKKNYYKKAGEQSAIGELMGQSERSFLKKKL